MKLDSNIVSYTQKKKTEKEKTDVNLYINL